MFIKRVSLQEFGRLNGTIRFEPNRCNIICQDNEYGKTTVMDAVLYTLYNFPTTGFSRDTLKPKDRYRPWNGESNSQNSFMVELEMHDVAGRNYVLRADFNRPQPFTLHDADTHQPITLDGMTFGQRYLRMPLSSFTQCFFLRQDEKEGNTKSQLVSVIEEAAASNRRETPGNVSEAIERLAAPRWSVPNIAPEPVLVKNLIKRLEDRKTELLNRQDALKRALDTQRHEIEASDEMDDQIAALEQQIQDDEHALLVARRYEKQGLLNRFNEGREAQAERARQLEELEPYADLDPARRAEVMGLLGDWKLVRQKFEEIKKTLEGEAEPELKNIESELATYPESANDLSPDKLESLRNYRGQLADRDAQLARQSETVSQQEISLREQGVPIERISELYETDSQLSPSDREVLFEHSEARNEAQTALTSIEQNALAAREQALKAKTRRSWFANVGMGITVAVVGFMAVGIVLLFTDVKFYGWVFLIAAFLIGICATILLTTMRSRISSQELEPALEAEMTLSAEARKIHEQLETVEAEYQAVLDRLGITSEQIHELREIDHWKQAAAPWMAARDSVERLTGEISEIRENLRPLVGLVNPQALSDEPTDEELAGSVGKMESYFRLQSAVETAREKVARLRSDKEGLESDLNTKDEALEALVQTGLTSELPDLEAKAALYLDGCEKALKLQTLRQEYGSLQAMTDEEVAALQTDIENINVELQAKAGSQPDATNETVPGIRPEELERKLAQSRRDRDELKERRNRGFRDAEQAVTDWRSKGPGIEAELAQVCEDICKATDFAKACELAHDEMSEIATQVYTQWATALNEKVNRIVPLVNDRYRDVALSPELDISVYSREAGRRLESREVQHLSKGARDQLLLAMRVAIAQYLSAHVGHLPLALDEPFAHWDDQRFVEGMGFLARLSEQHQVILLSCHGWRYSQLKTTSPDLFDAVNFCELQPD